MNDLREFPPIFEALETRRLLAWSGYARLIHEDTAASGFPGITGKGVTVAVIDTGVDYNVAALGGGFGAGKKVIAGYDFFDNDSNPMDESGHGTNVAGVIAANKYTVNGITYQGVAPDAKIVALRVGDDTGIPDANIQKALQWVITNHTKYGITVVNLSLGSGNYVTADRSSIYSDEFATLHDLGIFVTAASGNSQDQNSGPISQDGVAYPSADPNVFAVGAVDSSDVISSWTQRGEELDLLAPGVDIVMPRMGGGTITEDGTSFASPYVAGTAALLRQADSTLKAGDIGSILMSSGKDNRDGDKETGNTTGLLFSRLDINAALSMVSARHATRETINLGRVFDTALDSQGVLHAAFYDDVAGDVRYITRSTSGLWSESQAIDWKDDVGAQLSIAVDRTGKVGIGYFDNTNTAIKYSGFNGTIWSTTTIDRDKHVGTNPSLAFDIDGNAYLAYQRRSGGYLRLSTLDRDAGTWSRVNVDGGAGAIVGTSLSLDVGEAALRTQGGFTIYDTTVVVAYADATNGDLKYARLDLDDPSATWFKAVVDDANGINNVNLDLHDGFLGSGLQAQIAYQDTYGADVKYAYRNTDWFTETVAGAGKLGDTVQLSFDSSNRAEVTYFDRVKKALYTSTRTGTDDWSARRVATSYGRMSVTLNERTGDVVLSWLNRPQTEVDSTDLV